MNTKSIQIKKEKTPSTVIQFERSENVKEKKRVGMMSTCLFNTYKQEDDLCMCGR